MLQRSIKYLIIRFQGITRQDNFKQTSKANTRPNHHLLGI